jgi:hypothetical protein
MIRALFLALALATPAAADPVDDAIAAWVAADDATAMPALAALAAAGDTRAMLFLGAIEPRVLVTDHMLTLDRKARNALLRQPGGLSGKSWLLAIPADDPQRPLADAVLAARDGDPVPLLTQGQTGAAVQPLLRVFNEVPGRLASLSVDTPLSPTLQALIWTDAMLAIVVMPQPTADEARTWATVAATAGDAPPDGLHSLILDGTVLPQGRLPDPTDAAQAAGIILRMGTFAAVTTPQMADTPAATLTAATTLATAALMAAPEAAAHRALCAPCPDVGACTLTMWSTAGAYPGAVFPGTPLDAMVPPDVYLGSPRQMAEIRHQAQAMVDLIEPASCAAGIIAGN